MKEKYVKPSIESAKKDFHETVVTVGMPIALAARAARLLGDNIITMRYINLEEKFLKEENL